MRWRLMSVDNWDFLQYVENMLEDCEFQFNSKYNFNEGITHKTVLYRTVVSGALVGVARCSVL
jgi:hypothetical protein